MLKKVFFLILVISFSLFISCDLFFYPTDLYFWTLVDEYDTKNQGITDESEKNPITVKIRESSKIIMTRGEDSDETPGYNTSTEANLALNTTTFSLEENTNEITFNTIGDKEVRELNNDDYHICQDYTLTGVIKEKTYTITGSTTDSSENPSNIETKTIKIIFK